MSTRTWEAWVIKTSLLVNVAFGESDTKHQHIGSARDLDDAGSMLFQSGWLPAGGTYEWEPYENGWSTRVVPVAR